MKMNAPKTKYAQPQAQSRLDTMASSLVLATMLASVLAGAFVVESDPTVAGAPDVYASAAKVLS
jgi:hypothetical protein